MEAAQRVVVIQDASTKVCSSVIGWALHGLSLQPGDKVTLLAILHQVKNPSTLSFMGSKWQLGFNTRVGSSSIFGANERFLEREVSRMKNEYHNNSDIAEISKMYEQNQVKFQTEVAAGPSPKAVALKAARSLKATWLILDRKMKKDREFYLDKLSCGISRVKSDNNIRLLRAPKATSDHRPFGEMNQRRTQVMYDEMLPGSPEAEEFFSIDLDQVLVP